MRAPSAGQILGGKYRLERPLGKGGLAAVWRAEHLTLHSPIAIKIIDPISGEDEDALSRFMREARAAAALRSPHVVQILDYGVDGGMPFIVMELLEGESLERRLLSRERLPAAEVARIVKHIARAIGRAHDAGVVHRDLKPANIFIVPNDDEEIVKVLDFGVAKATTIALGNSVQVGPTPAGALLGTPHYMSPEQAQGVRTLDHRTDLWSMGIVAYECLLGTVPFTGHSLGSVLTAICGKPPPVPSSAGPVPAGFDAWFAHACAREPADRFSSAKQMADELARVCEGPSVRRAESLPSKRSTLGVARVQLPAPPRAVVARPLARREPLVDDDASGGLLRSLVRYKVQLLVAAVVAFAAAAALIESQKRRQRPALPAVATATGAARPSPAAPESTALPEPFSGLGRRVGLVPDSAKVVLSAPPSPAPPSPAPPSPAPAPVVPPTAPPQLAASVDDATAAAAVPASTKTATTANASASAAVRGPPARPAAIEITPERAPSGEDTSCDPPYLVDAAGIRRVKARCL
jgi:eukaryotic-like serine/threonine-protein kinase